MRARKLVKVVRAEMAAVEEQAASVNAEGVNAAVEAAENGEEADPADSARLNDKRMLLFRARKDWRRRWCKRFSVARRRRTNNKGKSLKGTALQDTYAEKGSKEVWIDTPSGSSLEKRQCTLQVMCYAADARGRAQCRLALIFRGLGQRITALEKESWDERVDVYFQANAWANMDFCLKWLERTYGPWAETIKGEKILLMDNLDGQFTASERRVLLTHWCGKAWDKASDRLTSDLTLTGQGEVEAQEVPAPLLPSQDEEKCDDSRVMVVRMRWTQTMRQMWQVRSDSDDEDSAPFFVPAGMSVQDTMPALDKTLVKTPILFKWVARGWQLGRVKKKLPRNDAGFNFKVYYGIDDREANHCLSEERYVGGIIVGSEEEVADGSWVALRK
ncbi:hypothetical protein CYMTET_42252 [Cymbomonas tetramitiformis]|uniref:DDE-1 domain-containing protein n=1 Tax=Cymbomonas tetramitiformis TaxID=36881 RepID=A0AAE0F1E9_9CHLO|nr:hypothetical protein CYMTET_42252 [Cymbomonas tetramitiformis]